MKFIYCPKCGEKLCGKELGDEGVVPYCPRCKRPWFDTFSTCVIVLVINEYNEALLLKQMYISDRYYNLVSGYMKPGETAEDTAYREVLEETGLNISKLSHGGTYWFEKGDMLMVSFIAKVKKKELTLSEEVDDALWTDVNTALNMVHPKGSISYSVIEHYLNCDIFK